MTRWSLEQAYDAYPRIEEEFSAALDESLRPRGPEMLFDLVAGLGLRPGGVAVDVGCGEGRHALELARRFGLSVTGVDPVPRHIEAARASAGPGGPVFSPGTAEHIPVPDAAADLVWCRDVLVHVADLGGAFAEFARVMRPGGHALVYHTCASGALEPREAAFLWETLGVASGSTDQARVEAAIGSSGLGIGRRVSLGSEWGEWAEERSGAVSRKLLRAARLLRAGDAFAARYGQQACDMMLADCLWHVYAMIGKLTRRVYLLTRPEGG